MAAGDPQNVRLTCPGVDCEIWIGTDLLPRIGELVRGRVRGPSCAVVADENTALLFGDAATGSLQAAGYSPTLIEIPAGEGSKSLDCVAAICDRMALADLDRSSFVVALGGGVIGDVAGFSAAIYHRGIACVQVPTTLLAQVDSAIGGKTGVNTRHGKNLLGAVHSPVCVIADTELLRTLPARQFSQGLAEVIKHAIIAAPDLLEVLETNWMERLPELVRRNVEIKANIVAQDPFERSGMRTLLNFGHTIGHAIERAADYTGMLHGEAVALGILGACAISVQKGGLDPRECDRVRRALERCGLPTKLPAEISRDDVLAAVRHDKKFEQGAVRFVVTSRLGSAQVSTGVSLDDIRAALAVL